MFHIRFGNKILCYKRKRMIFVSIQGDNLHKKVGQKNNNCLQIKKCSIFTHFFRPVACGIQHTFEVFADFVQTKMIQTGLCGSAFAGNVFDGCRFERRLAACPIEIEEDEITMALAQADVLAGLKEIVEEVAGIPAATVEMDKNFTDDLDVDSLSMVEVVVAAEERFGVKIPDDSVTDLVTVGDAVNFIVNASK